MRSSVRPRNRRDGRELISDLRFAVAAMPYSLTLIGWPRCSGICRKCSGELVGRNEGERGAFFAQSDFAPSQQADRQTTRRMRREMAT